MKLKKLVYSLVFISLISCSHTKKESAVVSSATNQDIAVETGEYDEYDEYADEYEDIPTVSDPFEKINRKSFDLNMYLLTNVVKPLILLYDYIAPGFVMESLYNMADRFYDFNTLVNSILQLDYKNSLKTLATFSLNMTFGFFSMFNVAEDLGLYRERRTLGQTLGLYGVGNGFFVMVPFFGPYTVREGIGKLTDMATSPFSLNLVKFNHEYFSVNPFAVDVAKYIGTYGVELGNVVKLNENFLQRAFDPYIFMRDAYIQNLDYKIKEIKENL